MATPQTKFGFTSSNKPNEPSYASLNEFSKMNTMDIYDNDVVNLRSQIQILEGKLVFYDREFQIKVLVYSNQKSNNPWRSASNN